MAKAKLTWLGEPGGAEENVWKGITFKKDEAVETDDEQMIEKAKNMPSYKVEESAEKSNENTKPKVEVKPWK